MDQAIKEIQNGLHTAITGLDNLKTELIALNSHINYLRAKDNQNEKFFDCLEQVLQDRKKM